MNESRNNKIDTLIEMNESEDKKIDTLINSMNNLATIIKLTTIKIKLKIILFLLLFLIINFFIFMNLFTHKIHINFYNCNILYNLKINIILKLNGICIILKKNNKLYWLKLICTTSANSFFFFL